MFETCTSMAELNEARINAIRSGHAPILVNRAYAHRKMELLGNQSLSYKKVQFCPAPELHLEDIIPINCYWEDSNPYRLIIEEDL